MDKIDYEKIMEENLIKERAQYRERAELLRKWKATAKPYSDRATFRRCREFLSGSDRKYLHT